MSVGIHGWRCALEQTEAAKEQLVRLHVYEDLCSCISHVYLA